MKKLLSFMMIMLFIVGGVTLSACGNEDSYVATASFSYSADKGVTYGNAQKEYTVGETIYMKVDVKVTSTNENAEAIKLTLTIPNITAVDAKYYDGQIITPTYDVLQRVTTYNFTVMASTTAVEWTFLFQFIPNGEAEICMGLVFDDHVNSIYDKQNTIRFVEG